MVELVVGEYSGTLRIFAQPMWQDSLVGGTGNDTLDGGRGADTMAGGTGSDSFYVDDIGDLVQESSGQGTDTILLRLGDYTLSGTHIENLTGAADRAFSVLGSSLNNVLTGGVQADTMMGDAGSDTLNGNAGADSLSGNAGNDRLDGGDGADWASYAELTEASQAVTVNLVAERATGAAGSDTLTGIENIRGGAGNDSLVGDGLANMLDGGAGADTMAGGTGDDVFIVGDGDVVRESADQGVDTILLRRASFSLGAVNAENVTGDTTGLAFSITGNGLANRLTGGALADTLNGGLANDSLIGGLGNDSLIGGSGSDQFIFNTALGATNVDSIQSYSVADDTILLDDAIFVGIGAVGTSLAASAFTTGTAATTADHRIVHNVTTGALLYDADGSGAGAAVQFATLTGVSGTVIHTEFLII
jgi:serralysin